MCVVVWRAGSKSKVLPQRPSPTVVVLYRADDVPRGYAGHYTSSILLPLRKPPTLYEEGILRRNGSIEWNNNLKFFSGYQTRATAFCDSGKSLKLYQPGSIVPYAIIPTLSISNGTMRRPELPSLASNNEITLGGHQFRLDTVFHSSHRFQTTRNADTDDTSTYCTLGCLSLAWLTKGRWEEEDTLFIMQSGDTTNDPTDCEHEDFQNGDVCVADRRYDSRIVACLRGLEEHWPPNNLAGLDTVCISQRGTRIAIACWDKILLWALDPSVLVEPWVADDDKSEAGSENGGGGNGDQTNNSNTASTGQHNTTAASAVSIPNMGTGATPSIVSEIPAISKRAMVKATRYYELTDDPDFGEIVELWPEVIPLTEGLVARKMMWPVANSRTFGEVYEENSEDSLRASDSEEESDDGTEQDQQHEENDEGMDNSASSLGSDGRSRPPRTMVGDRNLLINDRQLRMETMLQTFDENTRKLEAGEEVEPASEDENENGDPMCIDTSPPANAGGAALGDDHPPDFDGPASTDKGKEPEEVLTQEKEDELIRDLLVQRANEEWGGLDNQPLRRHKRSGEDKLVVMTDRGLVKWDLGPRAKRRRIVVDLVLDEGDEGGL